MAKITWDNKGFFIDGKADYMVSGEFHYFRVPKADWERRMKLFREAGGNTIATYVPWIIHEPEEGKILFDDRDERNLTAFLEMAKKVGLSVILRPGPYQYSELVNDGLPNWLVKNYPSLMAMTIDGKILHKSSVSYQHPLLLEKVRRYFKAFADVARPYLVSRGGPVAMVQLDNELAGIHLWRGSLDYNPETMGFGKENGQWPQWLFRKYRSLEKMNGLYERSYGSFAEVMPIRTPTTPGEELLFRDYGDFYLYMMGEYFTALAALLRENGMDGPLCHNSGSPTMNSMFAEPVQRMGRDFLLGSDHYYNLDPTWAQNHPTPQYALRCMWSLDILRAMGMPPSVLEMPAGNISDLPPILPGDLFAAYMVNAAFGMKGLNYYIYTGGPNFPGTGNTCRVYDYHAPVSAAGEVRETYYELQKFGRFLHDNTWMTRTERKTAVQLGFCWADSRMSDYQPRGRITGWDAWHFSTFDLLYGLTVSACPAETVPLSGKLDMTRPLVLSCGERMSRVEQQTVVDFIEKGGRVLLLPVLPTMNENGQSDTTLADYLGISNIRSVEDKEAFLRVNGLEDVYMIRDMYEASLPGDALSTVWCGESDRVVGAEICRGRGKAIWLGAAFDFMMDSHSALLENLCLRLGGKKVAESKNRNILLSYWSDGDHRLLYIMNLFTCPQETEITVYEDRNPVKLGKIILKPMEMKTVRL